MGIHLLAQIVYVVSAVMTAIALTIMHRSGVDVTKSIWDKFNVLCSVLIPGVNTFDAVLFWTAIYITHMRRMNNNDRCQR